MAIKLMYITNNPDIAKIADETGVDRVFIDLETIGKAERQGGMDTVQSKHTLDDIKKIKAVLSDSELLVRANPIYSDSKAEIDAIINNGADIIMLPYFKTVREVSDFLDFVDNRVKTCLLFETPEAVKRVDEILDLKNIDEVFIGLNDLSLGYGKKFMFELLADGTVEKLCLKFRLKRIPYGFGGIAAIGTGTLRAECILKEHYRLGSNCVILSRSFCNYEKIDNIERVQEIFESGISCMRSFENEIRVHSDYFNNNIKMVSESISLILDKIVR